MSEALKPCPFCGETDRLHPQADEICCPVEYFGQVICGNCDAVGALAEFRYDNKDDAITGAITAWNTRADLSLAMVAAAYKDAEDYTDCLSTGHADAIRARTPDDAKAELASLIEDAQRKAIAAALEEASKEAIDQERDCSEWFGKTRKHANVYEQLPIVADRIRNIDIDVIVRKLMEGGE